MQLAAFAMRLDIAREEGKTKKPKEELEFYKREKVLLLHFPRSETCADCPPGDSQSPHCHNTTLHTGELREILRNWPRSYCMYSLALINVIPPLMRRYSA